MKKSIVFIAVLFAAISVFSQVKFTCPNGFFKATYPSKVEGKVDKTQHDGETITLRNFYGQESNNVVYIVSLTQFPEDSFKETTTPQSLENAADAFFGSLEMEKQNKKEVKSGKVKGLEFASENETYNITYRVYITSTMMYQVAVLGVGEYPTQKKKDKFFKSFKILK